MKGRDIDLAILPWGSTEAHNLHLPYSSDSLESDIIAAEAARIATEDGAKIIVLPTIPYGVNTGQRDILMDIGIMPTTQQAILRDIIDVLDHQGVRKLLILNSHGGNNFKPILRELGIAFPRMFLSLTNWYELRNKGSWFELGGDHAEEMETSIMLHMRPDLVLPKEQWGKGKSRVPKLESFASGLAWTERRWPDVTDDTGIGNPERATREKGEAFFTHVTHALAKLFIDLSRQDVSDFYRDQP